MNYEDDLIDDEDYALLAKALIIKSKLQEATIDIHQEIIRKIQPSIINSALFTIFKELLKYSYPPFSEYVEKSMPKMILI